jgi:redox-sensitive bicupin YhaK (pirin superfamily)
MITVRRSDARGKADHGWLKSYHTFSFADYRDPKHMGFRSLRVINEDTVAAGQGFGTHPHNNMEIISYVISGELAHKDSMGNGRTIKPGEVQMMSAGAGVSHSEFNPSATAAAHFLQIWIVPKIRNVEPSYAEWRPPTSPSESSQDNGLVLVVSPSGEPNTLSIHQDAKLFVGRMNGQEQTEHHLLPSRGAWLQVIQGSLSIQGTPLSDGDGAAIEEESSLIIESHSRSHFLLFDLA